MSYGFNTMGPRHFAAYRTQHAIVHLDLEATKLFRS